MSALSGADVLVHFSAVNPYPNATWSESAQTMDHAFNVFQMAVMCKGETCFYNSLVVIFPWHDTLFVYPFVR
jgi:hypothetical protein